MPDRSDCVACVRQVHEDGHEELSTSHRLAENSDEQARLRAKNVDLGRALDADGWPGGPLRAWPGGLAVTRGIGDADCAPIVSCEPACATVGAPASGGLLVACSDGVWDTLSIGEAAKHLAASTRIHSPARAATKLVTRAVSKYGILVGTSNLTLSPSPTRTPTLTPTRTPTRTLTLTLTRTQVRRPRRHVGRAALL